jgi:hypothetical protein
MAVSRNRDHLTRGHAARARAGKLAAAVSQDIYA